MTNPTTPFSWQMPTATDLVTDLPADFEVFGQAVATSMADLLGGTTGQILAKNSNTNMDFVWIANDQGDITGVTATTPLTGGGTSGAITVGIQDGTTAQKGAVQLSDSTSTTSSALAATSTAVKAAYDLAISGAQDSQLQGLPTRIAAGEQIMSQAVWWIDCAQTDSSDQVLDNQGWGGTSLTTQLGSTVSADSNDPKYLSWDGNNYLYLPGVDSNYASTPDAAALDVTGDVDFRCKVALDDYTTATGTEFIAKWTGPSNYSYVFGINSGGTLNLAWTTSGAVGTIVNKSSTVAVGLADGATKWVRATLDVDNGASGNDVKFWLSDDGITWTQLGATVTTAGVTSIYAGTATVAVGAYNDGSIPAAGKFYRAQILNGIDGTLVFDMDTSIISTGADTSFFAKTGQTVTINRSTTGKKTAAVVYPLWLFGTDDYMEVADNTLIDFAATESFTLFAVARQFTTFGTNDAILAKKANTTNTTAGYLLGNDGTTAALGRMQIGDGAAGTDAVTGASRVSGTLTSLTAVRNVSTDDTIVYLNGTAATSWTSASDERLKDIIEPISNAVAKVGSLRAVIGKFKFDELNTRKPFLIAQDVQSVLPEAVDASNPDKLGVAYTDVIPLLVAAIQELTARVKTLEAR